MIGAHINNMRPVDHGTPHLGQPGKKTMTEAAATAAAPPKGKRTQRTTPRWRALQQVPAVDPGTANLVQ
jgi:hypothetical protein